MLIILTLLFTVFDQLSKLLVLNNIHTNVEIIKNLFYLTYTQNSGAAFSILIGKRIFLILITIIIIGLIIYYIKKNTVKSKLNILAFSLIIGGSLGNLIDRIIRGYVIDYISVKIFNYNFPIFNLGDTFICIGVFLLLIISFRKDKKHDNWRSNNRTKIR